MSIPELMQEIDKLNQDISVKSEIIDNLKALRNDTRQQLMDLMIESQLKSAKSLDGKHTATIASKPVVTITRDAAVLEWLEEHNLDAAAYVRVDKRMIEPIVKEALQRDGEIIPGTEVTTSEYLTMRTNKEEK